MKKTSFSIFNLQPVDGDGIKTSLLLRKERATLLVPYINSLLLIIKIMNLGGQEGYLRPASFPWDGCTPPPMSLLRCRATLLVFLPAEGIRGPVLYTSLLIFFFIGELKSNFSCEAWLHYRQVACRGRRVRDMLLLLIYL